MSNPVSYSTAIIKRTLRQGIFGVWLSLLFSLFAVAQQPVLVDPASAQALPDSIALTNIEFERAGKNATQTTIHFSGTDFQLIASHNSRSLMIDFPDVTLATDQLYRLNVKDFGTLVTSIETFEDARASRVVISSDTGFEYDYQKQNKQLIVTVKPKPALSQQEQTARLYKGDPISLDFQDVPVRQVLQIIAQVNGFNLVTTDTVTGNVTINLKDVPWDQALDMILRIKGLDKRQEANILLIAPAEELAARETQQLQSQKQVADLAPLRAHNVQINYAKASELAPILKSSDSSILSDRGSVTVDERTNTLIIRDTDASISNAINTVQLLDIPVRQVLIESRMVTVRDGVDEQIGVRWGFTDQQDSDGVSGSIEGAETVGGGEIPAIADRLNVNLPVSNPAGRIGISVARLIDGTILDLELSALEAENKGEIIASPRITVANQHEAYIEQGTEIPYVQATSSGATSVEFKKAVLSMKVVPHITPDNRVILDLVVTQDTRGETVSTPTGPAVAIDTQEISTQVLVENGETIVLGGIFQQTITDAESKVPVFGDIPVVGRLFKNSQQVNDKRELLIFVTPKILTQAL